jgi:hypothetical protein
MLFLSNSFGGLSLPASAYATQQAQRRGSPRVAAEKSLHFMAEKISKAVLDKDIPALLSYDRADLRANDEISLQNPKSDLYCYLFDSGCITWGDGSWRSVYDKLSQAHPLQIKVNVTRLPSDHQLYGSLLFYDGSSTTETDLQSSDFLCKEAPAKIASWKFRLEKGKWNPVTPLFDAETETLCAK